MLPTKHARRFAISKQIAKMIDNPLDVKQSAKFTSSFPPEFRVEAEDMVSKMRIEFAEAGGRPPKAIYQASKKGEPTKSSGGFGVGYYYRDSVKNLRETRPVLRHEPPKGSLATLEDIQKLIGKKITIENVRKRKTLPQQLKKAGYTGITDDGKTMLFDKP